MTSQLVMAETPKKADPLRKTGVQKMEVINETGRKLRVFLNIDERSSALFTPAPKDHQSFTKNEFGKEQRVAKQGSEFSIIFDDTNPQVGYKGNVKYGEDIKLGTDFPIKAKFETDPATQSAKMTITK